MTTTNDNHTPDPVPVTHDVFHDHAEAGYHAADAAISAMAGEVFTSEAPLLNALAAGMCPFLRGITEADQYAASGFLAGASNRVREALLQMSQPETQPNL